MRTLWMVIGVCLGVASSSVRADDWVTAVGGKPDRQGQSAEVGPGGTARLLWLGSGNSNLGEQTVTEGGRVFVNRAGDNAIYAHDLATGSQLWHRTLPPPPSGGTGSSHVSAVHDGQLYATHGGAGQPDYLYALDVVDGSILWRSETLVDEIPGESMSFSVEGDPIVGNYQSIQRIDRGSGRTVWSRGRVSCGGGSSAVAVRGNRFYACNSYSGPRIDVQDAATGSILYSGPVYANGWSYAPIFTGPGGRVYAPFFDSASGGSLVSYLDTGTALTETWRSPIPYLPFSSFASGDGYLYSYSTNNELLRLDASTGAIQHRSIALGTGSIIARAAIDAPRRAYVAVSESSGAGTIYSFAEDLTLLWSASVPSVAYSGLALGRDGTLMVCGGSGDLRAYRASLIPAAPFRVDSRIIPGSNGNGVIEPGETFAVDPSWRNISASAMPLGGTVVSFNGPPGASYTVADGSASYGIIPAGATVNCYDATANCYSLTVSNPSTRPQPHWDAQFVEGSIIRTHSLHIGKSFADVPTTSPVYKFVETIFHNNITGGCTTGNYCPDANVTRAQMAVFLLASKHGATWTPPPATGTVFTDVPANSFAAAWIERMPLEGISTGCGVGIYCPTANTTRAQMSVFLLRAQGGMSYNPPACTVAPFTDVPCSSPYAAWIAELVRRNIAGGCGNGKYCPDDPVTRGQMAVFLTTTFGLQLYAP